MGKTKIEWADESWNPVTGCDKISEGCVNCYAEKLAKRMAGRYGYPHVDPFQVEFHLDKLDDPLRWRKPRMIFVCSMGDLFHPDVTWEMFLRIFKVMYHAPKHTYMILTKRPLKALRMIQRLFTTEKYKHFNRIGGKGRIPKNIWIGVTAENQARADERIPLLLEIPAAVKFVSCEPLLGEIDLHEYIEDLSWVIAGGETGPKARPLDPDWIRTLRDCSELSDTPFFFKQWGEFKYTKKGDGYTAKKVGRKKAGRILDRKQLNEYPEV